MKTTIDTGKPVIERNETERYTADEAMMMLRAALVDVLSKYDEGVTYIYHRDYKGEKKNQPSLWYLTAESLLSYIDGWEPITEDNHQQVADELSRSVEDARKARQPDNGRVDADDWWRGRTLTIDSRFKGDD